MPPKEGKSLKSSLDREEEAEDSEEERLTFEDMGLDGRLLKAISTLGWKEPTLVQEKGIPLALEGKDILAKARTGTGKTGAYLIPIINNLISIKTLNPTQVTRVVILGPSRELTNQIATHAQQLNTYTSTLIKILDVGVGQTNDMKLLLDEKPEIIVSTPGKLLAHLKSKTIVGLKETLKFLVLDEADLMFSFGYESDIKQILDAIQPKFGCQCFLMSATLNPEVATLKKLCLRNPVTLKLEEPELGESSRLTQYHIHAEEEDKYVLMAALFKLKLIRGKTLIFTNSVDKCYRLRLFLELFGISSCILNPQLPVSSRIHVVHSFNLSRYNTIIASDETTIDDPTIRKKKTIIASDETTIDDPTIRKKKSIIPSEIGASGVDEDHDGLDEKTPGGSNSHSKEGRDGNMGRVTRSKERDSEYSASRGIDFQFVSNVINFDLPDSAISYIHRVGRTGRGARDTCGSVSSSGTALSFVRVADQKRFKRIQDALGTGAHFKPYQFRMEELDSFKYRTRDALRAVTSVAVREARIKEIKREMLNSEKLKGYFEEHPKDLKVLRADRDLHTLKHQSHLKDMPDYIIPDTLKGLVEGRSAHKPGQRSTFTSSTNRTSSGVSQTTWRDKKKRKRERKTHLDPLKTLKGSKGGNKRRNR